MKPEILMAMMAVLTLVACYVGWHFAKQAHNALEFLLSTRKQRDEFIDYARDLENEVDRLSDLVATLQTKVPARNARGKFVAR